ncbi:hypothetical protein AZ78_0689 [Lysobacter capsici AZ78]|uniref:Uncharacterized protein n=1 Tax=Lysobacter capsici AZ78 TaxID=1444315 RepID=A0A120AFJ9_9GAMM|nr:hypothetical protein AZ78_0689 [Lysobacter capsici AZ78]
MGASLRTRLRRARRDAKRIAGRQVFYRLMLRTRTPRDLRGPTRT